MENELEEFAQARTPALPRSAFLLTGDQQDWVHQLAATLRIDKVTRP